ncbi:hypothetical protein [Actinophytocola sediminis]
MPKMLALRFAAGAVLVVATLALLLPITISNATYAEVTCGGGLWGTSDEVENAALADEMFPRSSTVGGQSAAEQCAEEISGRRLWAGPLAGIGLVGLIVSTRRKAAPGTAT